jgi:hypothetical protein
MKIIMCSQNYLTHDGRGNQIGWPPRSPDVDPFEFSFSWHSAKNRVHSPEDENDDGLLNRIVVAGYSTKLQMTQIAREKTVYLMKI